MRFGVDARRIDPSLVTERQRKHGDPLCGDCFEVAAGRITIFVKMKRLGKESGGGGGAAIGIFGESSTGAATFESLAGGGVELTGRGRGRGRGRPESADVRIRNRFATLRCPFAVQGTTRGRFARGESYFNENRNARPAPLPLPSLVPLRSRIAVALTFNGRSPVATGDEKNGG